MRVLPYLTLLLIMCAVFSHAQQQSAGTSPPVLPLTDSTLAQELQKSKGNVLLVNVWATWCTPCVEEFPELLKVRNAYAARGLKVMFISVDDPKKITRDVRPFLSKMKVNFPTYIKQTRKDDAFMNILSTEWRGALPATFVFDRSGKLVETIVDATTFDDLTAIVEPLLSNQPQSREDAK